MQPLVSYVIITTHSLGQSAVMQGLLVELAVSIRFKFGQCLLDFNIISQCQSRKVPAVSWFLALTSWILSKAKTPLIPFALACCR